MQREQMLHSIRVKGKFLVIANQKGTEYLSRFLEGKINTAIRENNFTGFPKSVSFQKSYSKVLATVISEPLMDKSEWDKSKGKLSEAAGRGCRQGVVARSQEKAETTL